tara:strand:+ start:130 stop:630 length:501 start_codon:yes stop_codon:yes gene_type:complete
MARKRVIGIDPGITGGIVVLNEEGDIVQALRTPIYIEKSKKHYDVPGMREILMRAAKEGGQPLAGIEKVGTLPRDGRVGAFNFGVGYGLWLGLLSGLYISYMEITPQGWQSRMLAGLPKGPQIKASAVRASKSLFPHIPIGVKADWGIADAALIAEYARRKDLGAH